MTPLDRKIALLRRGITLDRIAAALPERRSISHISYVIAGKRRSPTIEAAVAKLAGVRRAVMFGLNEHPPGGPRSAGGSRNRDRQQATPAR